MKKLPGVFLCPDKSLLCWHAHNFLNTTWLFVWIAFLNSWRLYVFCQIWYRNIFIATYVINLINKPRNIKIGMNIFQNRIHNSINAENLIHFLKSLIAKTNYLKLFQFWLIDEVKYFRVHTMNFFKSAQNCF